MKHKNTAMTNKIRLSVKGEEISSDLTIEECLSLCRAHRKLSANATRFQMRKHMREE